MSEYPFPMISDVLSDCGLASGERGLTFLDELPLLEKMTSIAECAVEEFPKYHAGEIYDPNALRKVKEDLENGHGLQILYGADEFLTSALPPAIGENCPDEVLLEVEVISSWDDERDERTVLNLDGREVQRILEECGSDSNPEFSDYGSESGAETMDLSTTGTLDLSRKDSNQDSQNTIVNLTRAQIPSHISSTIFDMGQVGVVGYNTNSYLHYSGGTATSMDVTAATADDVEQNDLLDLSKTGQYYSTQRVKLEPNLGIDPSIQYKPEMEIKYKPEVDYNHNDAVVPDIVNNGTAYETVVYDSECIAYKPMDDSYDSEPRVKVEQNYSSQCQNIPLTVTSPDDDNDSGTESISSKDSDKSSSNKSDRKRPGRKKGQVSKVYHLWEFIRDVLADPQYCPSVIKWENEEEGIFRVVQSETAASLWGARKNNRTKMTYEKMSRSIRYSRKEGYFADIPKDKGYPKKLCFKFGKKAHGWSSKAKK